jgi:microcystin-dependent protein
MTTYTPSLRLAEMTPGDPAVRNAWGTVLDQTIAAVESAITGMTPIAIGGLSTYTLTVANNVPDQSRQQVYRFTGALTGVCTVTMPAVPKVGYVSNETTGNQSVVLTTGSGAALSVSPGAYVYYFCDGTNVTSPVTFGAVQIGAGMDFWGTTAPPRWLFPYGQAISRTTYAALFAVLGTTYGAGDGSTTFNLPDKRGRSSIGKDDMGGAAASRVTAAVSGVNGTTLGAAGGNQAMQTHNHGITDPGHVHGVTDPSHTHGVTDPGHVHAQNGMTFQTGTIKTFDTNISAGSQHNMGDNTTYSSATGVSVNAAYTGVGVASHVTGVSVQNSGAGGSQNLPPGIVCNYIIFAGV